MNKAERGTPDDTDCRLFACHMFSFFFSTSAKEFRLPPPPSVTSAPA